jgi:hypothetical protein
VPLFYRVFYKERTLFIALINIIIKGEDLRDSFIKVTYPYKLFKLNVYKLKVYLYII